MDPLASGYDASATVHDATACTLPVEGCTDSTSPEYLSIATVDSFYSSCSHPIAGCTIADGTANFDSVATRLSDCVFVQRGCTESTASNYVAAANSNECVSARIELPPSLPSLGTLPVEPPG